MSEAKTINRHYAIHRVLVFAGLVGWPFYRTQPCSQHTHETGCETHADMASIPSFTVSHHPACSVCIPAPVFCMMTQVTAAAVSTTNGRHEMVVTTHEPMYLKGFFSSLSPVITSSHTAFIQPCTSFSSYDLPLMLRSIHCTTTPC